MCEGVTSQDLLRFFPSFDKVVVPARRDSKYVLAIAPRFTRAEWSCTYDWLSVPLRNCKDHDGHIFSRIFLSPFWVPDLEHRALQNMSHRAIVCAHTAFPL